MRFVSHVVTFITWCHFSHTHLVNFAHYTREDDENDEDFEEGSQQYVGRESPHTHSKLSPRITSAASGTSMTFTNKKVKVNV